MESGHSHLVKYIKQYKKEHPHPPASSASSPYITVDSHAINLALAQNSANPPPASPRPSGTDSPVSLHQNTLYHSCSSLITVDEVGISSSITEKHKGEQAQLNNSSNATPPGGTGVTQSASAPEMPSSSTVNVSDQQKADGPVSCSTAKDNTTSREEMRRSRHRSKSATSLMLSEDSGLNPRKSVMRQISQEIPRPAGEGNESGEITSTGTKGSGRKLNGSDNGSTIQAKKRCIIS
eukprot:TRINITY_DN4393_c0_g1_i1.p1 TRINITY_DN4393_c0_g1~~TRINITY_DN4393_c0_g1_i1.p1  ORF type:complete len:236 (-),score=30.67 TRINITY_DN4393_c0_g1_i1:315-1022(-)